ncbi:aldehyde dehydrogenase (NADP(+)) [Glycomyces sp. L485]|uniref:aldehyde dehydrogenase (NADP(+)) n=1 Tax=Glycomyces sp. L485 TaxID=2909235 RepID=UPI001F4B8293|nr:aldehyde dehydrogenase (NADP(+)) [Glycomyces sp. L485]MCH7232501.1 aldehyde dehydrogenase (NADP(+)) [Glycomyces sp. L485]
MTETLQGMDPRTGESVGEPLPETPSEEVSRLAEAAAASGFTALSLGERADLLRSVADALRADEARIVATADAETALGSARLTGELARTCAQFELYAAFAESGAHLDVVIDHADPRSTPPRPDLRRWNVPLGPVAVFAASNFPLGFGVAGTDTASALAAGCPVVAKAHPSQPGTAVLLAGILGEHLGDAFAVVHGVEAGIDLVRHPAVRAAAFTGSAAGGRALAAEAASRPVPIPFFGEFGSLNPVVVTPEAARSRGGAIAADFAGSMTTGAGQFCTKPGLLFLPEGHGMDEALVKALGAKELHPLLNERLHDACLADARRLAAHDRASFLLEPASTGSGFGVTPGLVAAPASALDDALLTECFGPVALVLTYRDAAELERVVPRLGGNLAAAVHVLSSDDPVGRAVLPLLAEVAGRVIVNGWPTGVAVADAQHHGGPWPATTNAAHTSVGTGAVARFVRPVSYQGVPGALLPEALQEDNPLMLPRRVDGATRRADEVL